MTCDSFLFSLANIYVLSGGVLTIPVMCQPFFSLF